MALKIFVPRDATACALGADAVAETIRIGAAGRGIEVDMRLRRHGPDEEHGPADPVLLG